MSHVWNVGGTDGRYVHHFADVDNTGAPADQGTWTHQVNGTGVGPDQDVLGPFEAPSNMARPTQAEQVAAALRDAYSAGTRDMQRWYPSTAQRYEDRVAEAVRIVAQAKYEMGDAGTNDGEHDSLQEAVDFIATLFQLTEDEDGDTVVDSQGPAGAVREVVDNSRPPGPIPGHTAADVYASQQDGREMTSQGRAFDQLRSDLGNRRP